MTYRRRAAFIFCEFRIIFTLFFFFFRNRYEAKHAFVIRAERDSKTTPSTLHKSRIIPICTLHAPESSRSLQFLLNRQPKYIKKFHVD